MCIIMIKIKDIIEKAKQNISHNMKIEIEVESLEDLKKAIGAKPDTIMLDNMSLNDMAEAVKICNGQILLEASGGVNLENVEDIDGIQQIASLFYANGYYNEARRYFNIVWDLDSINCMQEIPLFISNCNFAIQAIKDSVSFIAKTPTLEVTAVIFIPVT